ncbi:MAG TPA: hypothetical protein VK211_22160 [Kamptonema sp.]|nr:hypothetical protein [Kamptonema sp.]
MPKCLVFIDSENASQVYGFASNSAAYDDPGIQTATGVKPGTYPSSTGGVFIPWRVEDLLQYRVLRSVLVYLNDGAGKRTSRRLYVTAEKAGSFRNLSSQGGLVGLTLGGKTIVSASLPRKATRSLL